MALTLAIICGGRSGEHEVSLRSAQGIYGAVDRRRFSPLLLAIDKQGRWRAGSLEALLVDADHPARIHLNPAGPVVMPMSRFDGGAIRLALLAEPGGQPVALVDVCFPIIHGTDGEDGALQGWLRMMGVPFVGADVLGSAIGMDKDVMKRLLSGAGLPIAPFRSVGQVGDFQRLFDDLSAELGLPLFVKPSRLGSSVGVSKVQDRRQFESALQDALRYDSKLMVEQAVPGRELECSVLGNRGSAQHPPRASRVGEIRPRTEFYSYQAKYLDPEAAELLVPAPIDQATEAQVQQLSVRVFEALECDGLARVDFFLTPQGRLVVNEINTLPGFTPISMYPRLWQASGLSFSDLVTQLVELGLERHARQQLLQRTYDLP